MNQQDWFAATKPEALANATAKFGEEAARDRRLRLFGCACVRQTWHLLSTNARSAVLAAERYAEGQATKTSLRAANLRGHSNPIAAAEMAIVAASIVCRIPTKRPQTQYPLNPIYDPWETARLVAKSLANEAAGPAPNPHFKALEAWHATWMKAYDDVRALQADYLRDVFPPPRYVPRLDPGWLTSTVVALAKQADKSGDFSIAPILADALQDAGCDDETMLRCCRVPGNVHVRGNWVVDFLSNRL